MNEHFKYDPEDIESLMLHKSFDDLLADEKTFVLKHLTSKAEYEYLRSTLLQTMDDFSSEEFLPPPGLKQNLVQEFRKKHKQPGFTVWLNGLFAAATPRPIYLQPYFQLAVVSVVVVIGAYLFFDKPETQTMAVEQKIDKEQNSSEPEVYEGIANEQSRATISEQEYITDISANVTKESRQESVESLAEMAVTDESENDAQLDDVSSNFSSAGAAEDMDAPAVRSATSAMGTSATKSLVTDSEISNDDLSREIPATAVNDELLNLLFSAR
jgi:hypothetical protein